MLGTAKNVQETIDDIQIQKEYENKLVERELCAIQNKFHLDFLSDIHDPRYHREILHYLYILEIDTFPLFLWRKLIQYFTEGVVQIESFEDVQVYLKEERKKR